MNNKFLISCDTCRMNEGDDLFPICRYEELDEKNNFMGLDSRDLDSMYTDECTRYIKVK